jgi:uncharacterized OsmC-like protein
VIAGVDVAGWYELARTTKSASWEAQIGLGVSAGPAVRTDPRCSAGPAADTDPMRVAGPAVRTDPMRVGPARAARPYAIAVGATTPLALLLGALGAGAAETMALSLALQGARPTSIRARAYGGAAEAGVDLMVAGAVTGPQLTAAAEHVRRFCPVGRTLAEATAVRLLVVTPQGSRSFEAPESVRPAAPEEVAVDWDTGPRSTITSGGAAFPADQPKQLLGTDRAPSPEEYLLAALAAEVARPGTAEVHVSARRDLRGALGFAGAPVGLRDVLVQRLLPADHAEPPAGRGPVLALLRQAHDLEVTVRLAPITADEPEN